MNNVITVGMAELKLLTGKGVLRSTGLGSCVGVALFDKIHNIAGMAHIMLPSAPDKPYINIAKYGDSGTRKLVELVLDAGANINRLAAKLAGGSQMFSFTSGNELLRIGPRNIEEIKRELTFWKIPIIGEDTGGDFGRTIEFSMPERTMSIRSAKQGIRVI